MRNSYIIEWKSKVNGRAGRGTKLFDRHEAHRLAAELNHEYPQISHEAVIAPTKSASEKHSRSIDSETVVTAE